MRPRTSCSAKRSRAPMARGGMSSRLDICRTLNVLYQYAHRTTSLPQELPPMQTPTASPFRSLASDEGDPIWTVGFLAVRKIGAEETDGRLEVAEFIFPGGYSPPWHVHHTTAESFYVLSGEIRFHYGDRVERHGPGGFVHLPAGVPHGFYVESPDGARALHTGSPTGLWDFHTEVGRPAPQLTLPPAEPLDPERLGAIAAQHGIDI